MKTDKKTTLVWKHDEKKDEDYMLVLCTCRMTFHCTKRRENIKQMMCNAIWTTMIGNSMCNRCRKTRRLLYICCIYS